MTVLYDTLTEASFPLICSISTLGMTNDYLLLWDYAGVLLSFVLFTFFFRKLNPIFFADQKPTFIQFLPIVKGLPVPILLFCSKRKRRGSFGGKAVLFMSGSGNGNLLHLKSSPSSLSQCALSSKKMALIVSWTCQTSLISVPLYYTILCTEDLSFHFFAQITIHSSCLPSNVICCEQLPGLP